MAKKEEKKIDSVVEQTKRSYSDYTDVELLELLEERGGDVYKTEDGRLIRKFAIRELSRMDAIVESRNAGEKLVRVIFQKPSNEQAHPRYIPAALDDKRYSIPYNVEVIIPKKILDIIADCGMPERLEISEAPSDMQGVFNKKTGNVTKTYPYTYLGEATDEDIARIKNNN